MKFDWDISVGNVLTGVVLFVGFYRAHLLERKDRERQHQQNIDTMKEIEMKMDIMYSWFERHVIGNGGKQ